jgi:RNA polymerase sigma-70 factor, ECF subfamily
MSEVGSRAILFEQSRKRLFGLAYRMLGSRADAEDMVQEAYLRWHQADPGEIRSPEAWLVTVVTRLCLDRVRSAAAERETYPGIWLPEPIISDPSPLPDEQLELSSNLSLAFMFLLERLSPQERAAFLLHDIFDCSYQEIARILDKSEVACRQIVSRARARVRRDQPRFQPDKEDQLRVMNQFAAALHAGDEQSLLALFAEDASLTPDGGGKVNAARNVIHGAARICRLFKHVARKLGDRLELKTVSINGEPGFMLVIDGRPFSALSFVTDGRRIHSLFQVLNPDKLKGVQHAE